MKTDNSIIKIRKFFRTHKRLPSYQEVADLFGFASKNAAFKLIKKLIDAGYLEKDETGRLVPKRLFAPLPQSGIVAAGFPSPTDEDLSDTISFDEYLVEKPESTFILKVSGESMLDAGIQPGDMVLLERGRVVKDGDIVVANIDGEWTLKYYIKHKGEVVLMPANKNFKPIHPQNKLEIGGVVVSVVRKYH